MYDKEVVEKLDDCKDEIFVITDNFPETKYKRICAENNFSDIARRYMFAEMILSDLWGETMKGHLSEYIICLDEIQHLNLSCGSTVHKMLRESRKYGVAMLMSTQFLGNLKDRESKLVLEQAAQRIFFRPPESNLLSIARSIDVENRRKWQVILRDLEAFEYVFAGNGIVDGKAYDLKCKLRFK